LGWMFSNVSYVMRYKPLGWLCYALIYAGAGLNPLVYHSASLLFHGLSVVVLYFVIRELLLRWRRPRSGEEREPRFLAWCAALGALAWGVHPLRVEAVAWVTDLAYCQALLLLLISLWCYLRSNATESQNPARRRLWYWAGVVAFAASMLSYPFAFGYAVVLMVLDVYPLRRFNRGPHWWRDIAARRLYLEKVPFALLGGLILLTLLGRLNPTGIWAWQQTWPQATAWTKVMQASYIWAYYLWKPCVPLHLSPVYTALVSFNPWAASFLLSASLVVGVTAMLVWRRRRWPWALALWVCHLVLLLPALGLTEHPHYPSDRYSYVPGILWSVLLAAALFRLSGRPGMFAAGVAASCVLLATLAAMSFRQTRIWRDSASLFEYTLTTLGDNPNRAEIHWRLGRTYAKQKRLDEAMQQYQRALAICPDNQEFHNDCGVCLLDAGNVSAAEGHFAEAVRLHAHYPEALHNLGLCREQQGRLNEARDCFERSLQIKPTANAHFKLGAVLAAKGDYAGAAAHYAEVCRLRPEDLVARGSLGIVLLYQGKAAEAVRELETALKVRPEAGVHYYLGLALDSLGKGEAAAIHYREAARLSPTTPLYLNDLAWFLATNTKADLRDGAEAVRLAEEACRLSGGKEARFLGTLDAAYAEAGRFADAQATAAKARELALASGQPEIARQAEERIALYQSGKPCTMSPPATGTTDGHQ
jgi:protein O-mannosyl-transferase